MITQDRLARAVKAAQPRRMGRVARVLGLHLEVSGIECAIGDAVIIEGASRPIHAEAIALRSDVVTCMPYGDLQGLRVGAQVVATGSPPKVGVGRGLLGRVLDGLGNPIDGNPLPEGLESVTTDGVPPHPLRRQRINQQLPLGVRVLDTLVPCGRGQRLGIFAGSGVGKSSLLSMIARGTAADVAVIALVGERGREVREFIEEDLGPEGLERSVVVVSTSDEPAVVRLRAAFTATRIAEWFRDQGNDVVLMMDSLTRFAMAQREVGLSAGEPPTTRGYPPSVFSMLPRLLERAGAAENGSITGLYTVLVEADDMNEPIGDTARSILDGHVVLSRRLATEGQFPTVDVLESISRVTPAITTSEQRSLAQELRRLLAAHREAKDLIEIGAYVQGTNELVDRAMALREPIRSFLCQDLTTSVLAEQSWSELDQLIGIGR